MCAFVFVCACCVFVVSVTRLSGNTTHPPRLPLGAMPEDEREVLNQGLAITTRRVSLCRCCCACMCVCRASCLSCLCRVCDVAHPPCGVRRLVLVGVLVCKTWKKRMRREKRLETVPAHENIYELFDAQLDKHRLFTRLWCKISIREWRRLLAVESEVFAMFSLECPMLVEAAKELGVIVSHLYAHPWKRNPSSCSTTMAFTGVWAWRLQQLRSYVENACKTDKITIGTFLGRHYFAIIEQVAGNAPAPTRAPDARPAAPSSASRTHPRTHPRKTTHTHARSPAHTPASPHTHTRTTTHTHARPLARSHRRFNTSAVRPALTWRRGKRSFSPRMPAS